ncbi:MAG: DMT family transporter [Candidatus Thorarchaeota archaeon]
MQVPPELYALGVLSALGATLLFGFTNIIYKKIDKEINIIDIVVTRVWISLPLAFVFAVETTGTINITVPQAALFPLAISMILGIVIGDTMYFLSQQRIGVARAFPIVMSYPLVVYLMAVVFLNEPIILQRIIGAFIVVIGVTMISRAEQSEADENGEIWNPKTKRIGYLAAFMTIICWAAGDVIFQFGLVSTEVPEANYYRILVASIIFVPIFLVSMRGGRKLPSLRISYVALAIGFVGFGVSLILYSYAIKLVGASITSVLIASAPVFTAPLSAWYLYEDVSKQVGVGTILTILGILLVVVVF